MKEPDPGEYLLWAFALFMIVMMLAAAFATWRWVLS